MSVNLSKTFLTFLASMLLVAASVMSSDAKPHANRHEPTKLNPRVARVTARYGDTTSIPVSDLRSPRLSIPGLPPMFACCAN